MPGPAGARAASATDPRARHADPGLRLEARTHRQRGEARCERFRVRIAGEQHESFACELALAADSGGDHRQARGQRLLGGDGQALEAAHVEERVGGREVGLGARGETGQPQAIGDAMRDRRVEHAVQLREPLGTEHAAHDRERGIAFPAEAREHGGGARIVLLRLDRTHREHQEAVAADAELRAHARACAGVERIATDRRPVAQCDHGYPAARLHDLRAHLLGAGDRERRRGGIPAARIVAPALARVVHYRHRAHAAAPQHLQQVVRDEVGRDRGRMGAPLGGQRLEERGRLAALAHAKADRGGYREHVLPRVEHRELDRAAARGLRREPLDHDALRAPGHERSDHDPQRPTHVVHGQEIRDGPCDQVHRNHGQ
jgi:hypothetical protein